jgi:lipoate-protein ligase A
MTLPGARDTSPVALLDVTLGTPEENLALDEALLNEAEWAARRGDPVTEALRFWESRKPFVVAGSTGRLAAEVHQESCRRAGLPVLRRASGGGTVLAGPGCLFFSLVLDRRTRPELEDIHRSYAVILERIAAGLGMPGLEHQGISDLALDGRKVSGNSQRRKSRVLLHHGTILYDFDLASIQGYLRDPPKRPAYRKDRGHLDFLTNLDLPADAIKARIAACWDAQPRFVAGPLPSVAALIEEKYGNPKWIERF